VPSDGFAAQQFSDTIFLALEHTPAFDEYCAVEITKSDLSGQE